MWQRIQTVYLLLAIISMAAMLFLALWTKDAGDSLYELNAFRSRISSEGSMENATYFPVILIAVTAILSIAISAFEIFQYKNRLTQMKLGALNSLIMSLSLGLAVFFIYNAEKSWHPELKGSYQIGMFMPAFALIFNMLANRFIRRDERLVRSVDRLR